MKLKHLLLTCAAMTCAAAFANITITAPSLAGKTISIEESSLNPEGNLHNISPLILNDKGVATYSQANEPVVITLTELGGNQRLNVFSNAAADNISVMIDEKGDASMGGTPLAEGIQQVNNRMKEFRTKLEPLAELYNTDPEKASGMIEALEAEFINGMKQMIAANPGALEAPYALMTLDGEDFIELYPKVAPTAGNFAPRLNRQKEHVEKQVAADRLKTQLENGTTPAPAFTLPDLAGKQVSLSDFRGKWVIIDFWGSWCRWCVKGFPELKELKEKYADSLVIVGVDCRDDQDRWRQAVEKYGLTWVNVYNKCDDDVPNALLEAYGVQGFPTKVIVNPEGIIKKIVVGADPSFPSILAELMGK